MAPHPLRPVFALVALLATLAPARAEEAPVFRRPSPALAALVDAPLAPTVVLSPDRTRLLLLDRPGAPALAELAAPELKLAGLRLDPATNGRSREPEHTGLAFQPIAGGPAVRVTGLPANPRISGHEWSRDGRHVALSLVRENGIELWLVEVASAAARRLTEPSLNATFGEPMVWLDDTTLLIRRIPATRGAAPAPGRVPAGPVVQENRGRKAGARKEEHLVGQIQPFDLIRYGFIPEFIGRLPVVGVLEDLDRDALIQILTKPKNAVIKQYQRLFEFENVRLKFSDDALEAIASLALERKVGARGLRMILEDLMLDLMYFLPSHKKVREFLVTKEMVLNQKINLALLEKAG